MQIILQDKTQKRIKKLAMQIILQDKAQKRIKKKYYRLCGIQNNLILASSPWEVTYDPYV